MPNEKVCTLVAGLTKPLAEGLMYSLWILPGIEYDPDDTSGDVFYEIETGVQLPYDLPPESIERIAGAIKAELEKASVKVLLLSDSYL